MREPGYTRPAGRPQYRTVALATASIALLVGTGIGAWFLVERHSSQSQAGNRQDSQQSGPLPSQTGAGSPVAGGSSVSSTPNPGSAAPSSTAAGSATPTAGPSPPGGVTIAPATTGDAMAPQIAAFLNEYFSAINTHDYPAYVALLSPQAQGVTQAQFDTGYGSTTDMDETLRGISSAANGDSVAQVTFTSHQSAAQSATSSTCTTWHISLYLVSDGIGYLLDNPPSSYHAQYAACE